MADVYICVYPSGYTLSSAEQSKYGISHRYTSLASAVSGEAQNWVTAGNKPIIEILEGDESNNWSGSPDTSPVSFGSAWGLSSTYPLIIKTLGTARSQNGLWDSNAYILSVSNNNGILFTDYGTTDRLHIHMDGLQIKVTSTIASKRCLYGDGYIGIIEFKNGYLWNNSNIGTCHAMLCSCFDDNGIFRIWNSILRSYSNNTGQVIDTYNDNIYVYNSTIFNTSRGVNTRNNGVTVKNSALFYIDDINGVDTNDIVGTYTAVDYCASDNVVGTNAVDISPGSDEPTEWAKAVKDYVNGDVTIKDISSVLYGAGNDLSNEFTDLTGDTNPLNKDMIGNNRTRWDIGAINYEVPAIVDNAIFHGHNY